jgi:hypothetical protein
LRCQEVLLDLALRLSPVTPDAGLNLHPARHVNVALIGCGLDIPSSLLARADDVIEQR